MSLQTPNGTWWGWRGVTALYAGAAGAGGEGRIGTVTHSGNGGWLRDSFFSGKAEERGIAPLFYLCIWLTYYEGTIPKEKKEKKNKKVRGQIPRECKGGYSIQQEELFWLFWRVTLDFSSKVQIPPKICPRFFPDPDGGRSMFFHVEKGFSDVHEFWLSIRSCLPRILTTSRLWFVLACWT